MKDSSRKNILGKMDFKDRKFKLALSIFSYFVVLKTVYFTGGTSNAYTHLIYFPITLSAYYFGLLGGVIGGIFGGGALAFMPLDIEAGSDQSVKIWLSRFLFLTFFGMVLGKVEERRRKKNSLLEKMAKYDSVTSLPKRIVLSSHIETLLEERKRFSIGAIYIENLREIFNVVGPSKGQEILKGIADFFEENKIDDCVKIYNSHSLNFEFLLEGYNENDAVEWSGSFIKNLKSKSLLIEGHFILLNFSLGITCSNTYSGTPDSYIKQAYDALDYAYNNSFESYMYDSKLEKHFFTTYLASLVDQSLENNEFYIEYQPKLDMRENRIKGAEALIRWNHSEFGLIPPGEFIPKLEKTNMIIKITNWIIDQVIRDIEHLKNEGIDLKIAVNVCPKDLKDDDFSEFFLNKLKKSNVSTEDIELEITETDFITNIDRILQNISILNRNGVKISIDDFGTGYSSLSYLSSLPIDCIKIDRSLIKDIPRNKKKETLIKNAIDLAHNLKKTVVAEGIEDKKTLDLLKGFGCETGQGYYIARPMKLEMLKSFLHGF